MPLTVKEVKNARPGRHSDGNGLYLLVKPTGSASWVLRVQDQGRRQDFGLGSVTIDSAATDIPIERRKLLTLAEAREKARIGRALAKAGISPSKHWRQFGQLEEAPHTFRDVAVDRHKSLKTGWRNGKHQDQWITTLQTYAFPTIGSMAVEAVNEEAIERILMPIWLSKPETARRVKQRIGAVLDYAKFKGWRATEAPMRAVDSAMKAIKQPPRGNFAAMPYKDIPAVMAKLREPEPSIGRLALQFLILNASRTGEVRGATWSEIDMNEAEWRIAPERMKAGKLHVLPLTAESLTILKTMRELFGGKPDGLVFPGNKGAMSDATMAKAFRLAGGADYTVHGIRSSFRDWCAETGKPNDWAEAALAHSVKGQEGKTAAAYKRTTYFEHRRDKLMPAWAAFVLNDQSNVVQLAKARA